MKKGYLIMGNSFDIIIIGGGIAAVSAALTATNRGKTVAAIVNPYETSNLYKAENVTNYPGIKSITGAELAKLLNEQLEESGTQVIKGRALSVMPLGKSFGVAVGTDFYEAKAVILATGITREKLYPGEAEFLGRGVSYCATCDGMLYRGKRVALIGSGSEAEQDADFLRNICAELLVFDKPLKYEILGSNRVESIRANGQEYTIDGVFIIKETISVTQLVPGLKYESGGIVTDKVMSTNVPGVFAAGDCTGKPYQLAKAAGEGNIAALSACEFVDKK
jgi:thioredoxin reductase (NADPH)